MAPTEISLPNRTVPPRVVEKRGTTRERKAVSLTAISIYIRILRLSPRVIESSVRAKACLSKKRCDLGYPVCMECIRLNYTSKREDPNPLAGDSY